MGRLLDIARETPLLPAEAEKTEEKIQENLREKRIKSSPDPFCAFRAALSHEKLSVTPCALDQLNIELDRLHEDAIRLRYEDPPKGTRAAALVWLSKQIEKLAARSVESNGTADGWPDPDDVFADNDQIKALRESLAEVETGPYPLALPDGCYLLPQANFNPFAYGRLLNGKLAA